MKVRLSKSIAEIEEKEVNSVWEPPDIYKDIVDNYVGLIYGRKGSGKSTIIDYFSTKKDFQVVIIRPNQTEIFSKVITAIDFEKISDNRIIEESIISVFEFVFFSHLAIQVIPTTGATKPGSEEEIAYKFLTKNGFIKGSVLKQCIDLISSISDDKFKLLPNFSRVIDQHLDGIKFSDLKDALCKYISKRNLQIALCIDDIDAINFSFSRSERLFINSLIVFAVKNNVFFTNQKIGLRIILTAPSEIFFHSQLYGSDWVMGQSKCLSWDNTSKLQELVNKRIAYEFKRRKRKRRFDDDRFSISTEVTWNKLFPMKISNKCRQKENSFEYLLRHTFYIPRNLLNICDQLLDDIELEAKKFEDIHEIRENYTDDEWSYRFNEFIELFTSGLHESFLRLFSRIYSGLDEVLSCFASRPNIWTKVNLHSYIRENKLCLHRIDNGEKYTNESLVYILQRIGFWGLGQKNVNMKADPLSYSLSFSYLEKIPNKKSYEIIVISPIFYDSYDIIPYESKVIAPHKKLLISNHEFRILGAYNHEKNSFPPNA